MNTKYTIAEIERRWLVELAEIGPLAGLPVRQIEDRYLQDTRMRLRKVLDENASPTYKLGKKYGKSASMSEPVVSIYLTESEYQVLSALRAAVALKARYSFHGGSLDVYSSPTLGCAIFEVEFTSIEKANAYVSPSFARKEITNDEKYSGLALAAGAG